MCEKLLQYRQVFWKGGLFMKWTRVDLQKYEQAKEYIDTVIVPLAPFQIGALDATAKNADQL